MQTFIQTLILHVFVFQVETNLQLLHEWGWEQPVPGDAARRKAVTKPASPKGSKFKAAVDRVLLQWFKKEITE